NGASVRFLIDGAPLPSDAGSYERVVLLFDGGDPDAVEAARERWTAAKGLGFDVTYWQTDERGRWQRKGGCRLGAGSLTLMCHERRRRGRRHHGDAKSALRSRGGRNGSYAVSY